MLGLHEMPLVVMLATNFYSKKYSNNHSQLIEMKGSIFNRLGKIIDLNNFFKLNFYDVKKN